MPWKFRLGAPPGCSLAGAAGRGGEEQATGWAHPRGVAHRRWTRGDTAVLRAFGPAVRGDETSTAEWRREISRVKAKAAGHVERVSLPSALGAKGFARLKGTLTREGKATPKAKRSGPRSKVLPEFPADAGSGQTAELLTAARAIRRKHCRKQTIDKLSEERRRALWQFR